jgi:AraC family ethanolamine operon transcriptional activator
LHEPSPQNRTGIAETGPRVSTFSLSTQEHDEFAAALLGGSFEYLPFAGRPYAGALRTLEIGDILLQAANDGAHLARAAFHPQLSGLLLPLRYEGDTVSVNGARSGRTDMLLAPGGCEFISSAPDALDWVALALPTTELERLAEFAPPGVRRTSGVQILTLASRPFSELSATLRAVLEMAERPPAAPGGPCAVEALAGSLRELLMHSLAPGIGVAPQRRATRDAMRVVRDAEAFLYATMARPLYRDDLCAALGVSRRKLHDAFVSTTGMTPPTYLKTRRLVLVRRALKAARNGRPLVKSVALAHGFWHLGYFAQDYRELFGELPSETLDDARARDARDAMPRLRIA